MRLNLGSGGRPLRGYVNVDRVQVDGVDVVHDLDVGPWPWSDESAEEIEARDVFEHVADALLFMTECWRILAPYNLLRIHTPYWRSIDAFTDPTHRRFPTEHTFDYWIPGTVLYGASNAAYGGVAYQRVHMGLDGGSLDVVLRKLPRDGLGSGRP
ncbi:MAG TPA: hypothetical protein VFB06_34370 [Streptosporangiaceae bacterium]|nr:hypothetical protein [Streptosporangiaceae bacterium]